MLLEFITNAITSFLELTGYPALVILMAMESMILPVPSEAVMPFAGFLVAEGRFSLFYAIIFSTLGTILGSIASYYIGLYGGNPFIRRFGKYLLLDESSLTWTEHWFKKHGSKTIFISRFIPVVRHVISIPAGMGRMNFKKFILYTALGGLLWNSFLLYLGILLKANWELVEKYSRPLDYIIIVLFIVFIIWFVRKHVKRRKFNHRLNN